MYNLDNYNFTNKKVLLRVDFNVPINAGVTPTDDMRIKTALPTITKLLSEGAAIIILTHRGQPQGVRTERHSLVHILPLVKKLIGRDVKLADDVNSDETAEMARTLKPGEIMMLENLRFYKEEEAGDDEFAKKLASLGDVYVNDAFGTAHRNHASTAVIAKYFPYDKMFGYLIESEMKNLDRVMKEAAHPFTLMLGGDKVTTKINIVDALLPKIDNLILGGGICFTFFKAMGINVGNSLVEEAYVEVAKKILEHAKQQNVRVYLPEDVLIADGRSNDANIEHCEITEIKPNWIGLDIGIKSADNFAKVIEDSKTLLWDGPMGVYEMPHFSYGTQKIALSVGRQTDKGLYSVVGGGDTIAALNKYSLAHKISYLSSAGGALLEYIEGKNLPGIRSIKESFSVDDYNFNRKRVLMRVDFNVPLDKEFNITDDTRIVTAIPTIRKILADNGSVILMTHLGRPKGGFEDKYSIRHIVPYLCKKLELDVKFPGESIGPEVKKMADELKPREVMILENLRFHPEEEKNDENFAKQLAELGDVYIMNAFGTAHRAHASTYMVAKFFPEDKMLGYLVESEINHIERALHKGEKPFTAIVGGSKVSTKIDIIKALMDKVDNLIIGGGIAFTFIKAMGGSIGNSLVEDDYIGVAKEILDKAILTNVKLYLPTDCLIADKFDNEAHIRHVKINEIPDGWSGLDIGVKSAETFSKVIERSRTILWNGPMGVFEFPRFAHGTFGIAQAVADSGAVSIIGGGESVAAINQSGLAGRITHISTGGGASLEMLEGLTLPGVAALQDK